MHGPSLLFRCCRCYCCRGWVGGRDGGGGLSVVVSFEGLGWLCLVPLRLHTEGPSVLGSYTHCYRWIAQSVLGNARTEAHVSHLLRHATIDDGRLVQAVTPTTA
jgi:hypothetical protein